MEKQVEMRMVNLLAGLGGILEINRKQGGGGGFENTHQKNSVFQSVSLVLMKSKM